MSSKILKTGKPVIRIKNDKKSRTARMDRIAAIAKSAPQSPLWQIAEIQAAALALIHQNETCIAADTETAACELKLAGLRQTSQSHVNSLKALYDVFLAVCKKHIETIADATGLGLDVSDVGKNPLATPLALSVQFDVKTREIHAHATMAPGSRLCHLEWTGDALGPDARWTRAKGSGVERWLAGFPPGTYHFRAAAESADDLSGFTEPVLLIVP